MIFDNKAHYVISLRNTLSTIIVPIQYSIDLPMRFVHTLQIRFINQETLLAENNKLKTEQLLLRAQIQTLENEQEESKQLSQLLHASSPQLSQMMIAQLLAVDPNPASHQIILNRGSRKGVYVGQPVLDAYGIMGQVIEVSPFTSRVLLIIDTNSAIPVQNRRNGYRAIAEGMGRFGEIHLLNIPNTADFQVGDTLVSSGLDGRYPVGYPVGTVTSVEHRINEPFTGITAQPLAHLNQSRFVLLVWPAPVATPLSFKTLPSNEGTAPRKKHGNR